MRISNLDKEPTGRTAIAGYSDKINFGFSPPVLTMVHFSNIASFPNFFLFLTTFLSVLVCGAVLATFCKVNPTNTVKERTPKDFWGFLEE